MGDRATTDRVRAERAATLVEYVLLVAVLAVATTLGLRALESGAERSTENTAAKISSRSVPSVPHDDGSGPLVTTTTSTVPPTTAAPTTTAAPPPPPPTTTPTTAPPAPAATQVAVTWGTPATEIQYERWLFWQVKSKWKATVSLTLADNLTAPVANATATVRVEYHDGSRWRDAPPLSATTSSAGTLTFDSGMYGYDGTTALRFTVQSVTAQGLTWNQPAQQVEVTRP